MISTRTFFSFLVLSLILCSCEPKKQIKDYLDLPSKRDISLLKKDIKDLKALIRKSRRQDSKTEGKSGFGPSRFSKRARREKSNSLNPVSLLKTNRRDFRRKYRETEFDKKTMLEILSVDANILEDLSKNVKIDEELFDSVISHWKIREVRGSFHVGRALLGILKERGFMFSDAKVKRILMVDPHSLPFLEGFLKDPSNESKFLKSGHISLLKAKLSELSKLEDALSLLVKKDKKFANAMLKKLYLDADEIGAIKQRYHGPLLGGSINWIKTVFNATKFSSEEYRSLMGVRKDNICDYVNSFSLQYIDLKSSEGLKCLSKLKEDQSALRVYVSSKKEKVSTEVLSKIAVDNPSVLLLLRGAAADLPGVKRLKNKYRKIFKSSLLKMHLNLSQKMMSDPRGISSVICNKVFPPMFFSDFEVLVSGLMAFPPCSAVLPADVFKKTVFRSKYLSAWSDYRKNIEVIYSQMIQSRRRSIKEPEKRLRYFSYLKERFSFGSRITVKNGKPRFSPLRDLPIEVYSNKKFVTSALDSFPEDYFSLPLTIRSNFEKFKNNEHIRPYNALYSRR